MKKIEIEVPDGKTAEWVDGVLTLVHEKPQDITGRIKCFAEAVLWCEVNRPLVIEHWKQFRIVENTSWDIEAYLQLRIITCALNEGWKPTDLNEGVWVGYDCETDRLFAGRRPYASVPTSLWFKTMNLANYAAERFRGLYLGYFGVKEGGAQ